MSVTEQPVIERPADPQKPRSGGSPGDLDFGTIRRPGNAVLIVMVIAVVGALTGVVFLIMMMSRPHDTTEVAASPTPLQEVEPVSSSGPDHWYSNHSNVVATGSRAESTSGKLPPDSLQSHPVQASPTQAAAKLFAAPTGTSEVGSVLSHPDQLMNSTAGGDPHQVQFLDSTSQQPGVPLDQAAAPQVAQQTASGPAIPTDGTSGGAVAQAAAAPGDYPGQRQSAPGEDDGTLHSTLQAPPSRYVVPQGYVIPAAFKGALNSDFPGKPSAMVTTDVYDANQSHKLIPKGSFLFGDYRSGSVYGQNKVFIVWSWLRFPNNCKMRLNQFAAQDESGAAAVNARVDKHIGNLLGSALLLTMLNVVNNLTQSATSNVSVSLGSSASPIQNMADMLIGPAVQQPATLHVDIGAPFYVGVEQDMVFPSPYPFAGVCEAPGV